MEMVTTHHRSPHQAFFSLSFSLYLTSHCRTNSSSPLQGLSSRILQDLRSVNPVRAAASTQINAYIQHLNLQQLNIQNIKYHNVEGKL